MEYVFGTVRQSGALIENLKTKSEAHTDLSGFRETVQDYPDCTITDKFRILGKYRSDEDGEGTCYDWYLIDRHYRMVDRTGPVHEAQEKNRADIDFIAAMTDVDLGGEDTEEAVTDGED